MIVGLAWYRAEDYPRVLSIMEDAADLPDTYKGWLRRAEKAERGLGREGVLTLRIMIEPDAFLAFCARQDLRPVASTRSRYASDRTAEITRPTDGSEHHPFSEYLALR